MTWQDININTNSTEWLGWWSEDWQGGWWEVWGQEVSVWAWGCTYGSRHEGSNLGIACAPTESSHPRRITRQWVTRCIGHLTAPNLSHWLPDTAMMVTWQERGDENGGCHGHRLPKAHTNTPLHNNLRVTGWFLGLQTPAQDNNMFVFFTSEDDGFQIR